MTRENDDTSQRAYNPSRLSRLAKIDEEGDFTVTEDQPTGYLVIINDGPYGNERSYNGLRLAMSLTKRKAVHVRVFLMECSAPSRDRKLRKATTALGAC